MRINGVQFFTVSEMEKELNISRNTIKHRIFELGISPVSKDALYTEKDFESIRNVPGKGRPKKDKQ